MREHLADAYIFDNHGRRQVTGLAHDIALVHAIRRSLDRKSCAKTVAPELENPTKQAVKSGERSLRALPIELYRNQGLRNSIRIRDILNFAGIA